MPGLLPDIKRWIWLPGKRGICRENKRSILFAETRKKNNGQMSMDDGQLLEALLPSKDKEGKTNEKRK